MKANESSPKELNQILYNNVAEENLVCVSVMTSLLLPWRPEDPIENYKQLWIQREKQNFQLGHLQTPHDLFPVVYGIKDDGPQNEHYLHYGIL